MKKGFTLIELLAVIVILAIIALIATPIILGIIKDSKEQSTKLSIKNYLRAVEIAISNESLKDPSINLNGTCEIIENGNKIECGTRDPIKVEYNGEGLIKGTLLLENGIIVQITNGEIDNWNVTFADGEINLSKEEQKFETSTLITGSSFNTKIKRLANSSTFNTNSEDFNITSIEFYSKGKLPEGYTKQSLENLQESQKVDVSLNNDGSIIAYYIDGKVFVCSNNLISFNEDASYMFYKLRSVLNILFTSIDTSQTTNMKSMFAGCKVLIDLDVSKFNTSQVTNMYGMFDTCNSLTQLNLSNFDTNNVTDMDYMFFNDYNLENINLSGFKTNKVTTMKDMFSGCKGLTSLDLSSFETGNVTTMYEMFYECGELTELYVSNFKTNNVTNMEQMFKRCYKLTNLNLSKWNTSNVTTMYQMFTSCSKLTTIDLSNWNTSSVTNMHGVFDSCIALTNINLSSFNTSNVTTMQSMFWGCKKLESITIGCNWKTAENTTTMFEGSSYTLDQYNTLVEQTQANCQSTNNNS